MEFHWYLVPSAALVLGYYNVSNHSFCLDSLASGSVDLVCASPSSLVFTASYLDKLAKMELQDTALFTMGKPLFLQPQLNCCVSKQWKLYTDPLFGQISIGTSEIRTIQEHQQQENINTIVFRIKNEIVIIILLILVNTIQGLV